MNIELIAITGFMAAGKTTVGRALASRLGCAFVDLDEVITEQQKKTINELIKTEGEDFFRDLESKALAEILQESGVRVIALGGGTWSRAENRGLLKAHDARVVWLDTPFELCWQRIPRGENARPLAPSRDVAEKLYHARRPVYELAEICEVVSENKTPEEVADEIAAALMSDKL
ncbi:MAG: shikimate kinase [Pyrinomonadaceae bacterium]